MRVHKLLAPLALVGLLAAAPAAKSADIVETAAGNDDFSTLVAAVKPAGLVNTLQGDGPFTVFAPTDAALGKLPKGTISDLLKPENKSKLASILTYRVIPGKVMAARITEATSPKTVNGEALKMTVGGALS